MVSVPIPADGKTAANDERAEYRRIVSRAAGSVREYPPSVSAVRPAFDVELLFSFARSRLSAAYALPLLVAIVVAAALLWIPVPTLAVWVCGALFIHVVMLLLCHRLEGLAPAAVNVRMWTLRFVATELAGGVMWAVLLVLAERYGRGQAGIEVFEFATALIAVSVTTILASMVTGVAIAGTLPVTLALMAIFFGRHDLLFIALAIMALGAQTLFLILAQRLYSAQVTMIEYRAEKDLLIAELGREKSISDAARRRAEEANLAKSRFLATMSHELRTPLNAILGFSEVMRNGVLGPMENPSYRDYVGDIHTSGQHLLNLINEILDLSRIEAGRQELVEEPVNLVATVGECCRLMQLKARTRTIRVIETYEPAMPRLLADERAVRQIVLNLLSNAIKFTPPGGEITVKAGWTASGGQYVSVADNGPGIPPEEIPIVMSSFGQGSIAIKSAEQGAGLGLPIVQGLMRLHDGAFELKSRLREGTETIAMFPLSRVMEALPPIAVEPDPRIRDGGWRKAG